MRKVALILVLMLALGLVACGGDSAPAKEKPKAAGPGDAAAGEKLFKQNLIGTQAGCMACHSLSPGVSMVGPSLATIGADAASRVPGASAEDYLHESILDPNAFIVKGFAAGIMPAALADELSEQQVLDLIAFMQTLK